MKIDIRVAAVLIAILFQSAQAQGDAAAGGTVGGGVISYEINGRQYVASTSGTVSGFFGGNGTAAIVIFSL